METAWVNLHVMGACSGGEEALSRMRGDTSHKRYFMAKNLTRLASPLFRLPLSIAISARVVSLAIDFLRGMGANMQTERLRREGKGGRADGCSLSGLSRAKRSSAGEERSCLFALNDVARAVFMLGYQRRRRRASPQCKLGGRQLSSS